MMIKACRLVDSCSSADARLSPTSGAGWQRWNRADIDLNSRRKPLRNFKYESYSKPEEDHFQLRIIWLLSIVSRPLQSGSRSNGEWTATYLGAIDHWIFSDWTPQAKVYSVRMMTDGINYWEDHLNTIHSSQCHKFQGQLVLKLVDKVALV
jgi:hypothetical protein